MAEQKKRYHLFRIESVEGQKPRWQRVGVGFVNRDESINIKLDFPIEREWDLQLRVPEERKGA
jgi:hypothetical protein